jgi:hypothetical protein
MNYTKPEVAVLGEAVRVIENRMSKGQVPNYDGPKHQPFTTPAYDLDE